MERGRKMTENSYKTRCGCIHYFVNKIDKQKSQRQIKNHVLSKAFCDWFYEMMKEQLQI